MNDRKSCCATPGVGGVSVGVGDVSVDVGSSKILKFYVKVYYVMCKGLSGKLSCMLTGHLFSELLAKKL